MKTKDVIAKLEFVSAKLSQFREQILEDIYKEDWMDREDLVCFNQINKDLVTCIDWLITDTDNVITKLPETVVSTSSEFNLDHYHIFLIYECLICKNTEEDPLDWGITNHICYCGYPNNTMEPVAVKISKKEK